MNQLHPLLSIKGQLIYIKKQNDEILKLENKMKDKNITNVSMIKKNNRQFDLESQQTKKMNGIHQLLSIEGHLIYIKQQNDKIIKLENKIKEKNTTNVSLIKKNNRQFDLESQQTKKILIKKIENLTFQKSNTENILTKQNDKIIKLKNKIKEKNTTNVSMIKKNNRQLDLALQQTNKILMKRIENLTFQKSNTENILKKYTQKTEKQIKIFESEIKIQYETILEKDKISKKLKLKVKKFEKQIMNYLCGIQNLQKVNHEIQNLNKNIHEMKEINELGENSQFFQDVPDNNSFTSEIKMKINTKMNFENMIFKVLLDDSIYPWGFDINLDKNWEFWHVAEVKENSQAQLSKLEKSWKIKGFNGEEITKSNYKSIMNALQAKKCCQIMFEKHVSTKQNIDQRGQIKPILKFVPRIR